MNWKPRVGTETHGAVSCRYKNIWCCQCGRSWHHGNVRLSVYMSFRGGYPLWASWRSKSSEIWLVQANIKENIKALKVVPLYERNSLVDPPPPPPPPPPPHTHTHTQRASKFESFSMPPPPPPPPHTHTHTHTHTHKGPVNLKAFPCRGVIMHQ